MKKEIDMKNPFQDDNIEELTESYLIIWAEKVKSQAINIKKTQKLKGWQIINYDFAQKLLKPNKILLREMCRRSREYNIEED